MTKKNPHSPGDNSIEKVFREDISLESWCAWADWIEENCPDDYFNQFRRLRIRRIAKMILVFAYPQSMVPHRNTANNLSFRGFEDIRFSFVVNCSTNHYIISHKGKRITRLVCPRVSSKEKVVTAYNNFLGKIEAEAVLASPQKYPIYEEIFRCIDSITSPLNLEEK